MTDRSRTTGDDRSRDSSTDGFRRREFVALGAGASATLLAGCAGDGALPSSGGSDGSDGSDGADGSETLTGGFRLLISDAPADIADFDRLDVTLSEARIFEAGEGDEEDEDEDGEDEDGEDEDEDGENDNAAGSDDEDDETNPTGNETESETDSPNGTVDEDADEEDDEDADEEDDGDEDGEREDDRGFTVVALDGATVDLTQVIEEDATAVFDGDIPAGSYEKIELSVSDVEGIVGGEAVDVKLPSEKLQITNGFEVTPDEPVSFVFDINVVKRGPNNGYILKPVISGSGVAGRDVDVNEIDDEDDADGDDEDNADGDDEDDGESNNEDDEEGENDDGAAGNETDGAENGTAAGDDS